jgi:hypothetical protein
MRCHIVISLKRKHMAKTVIQRAPMGNHVDEDKRDHESGWYG